MGRREIRFFHIIGVYLGSLIPKNYQIVRKYIRPYRVRFVALIGLAIVCAFFEAISLGALVPLVQLMESQQNPGGTFWEILQAIFQTINIPLNFTTLLILLTCLFILGQFILFYKKKGQVNLRVDFIRDMKVRAFREILSADMTFHHSQKAGNFLNLLVMEIEAAGMGLFSFTEYLTDIFFIGVYSLMLLYISVLITIIVVVIALISFYAMNVVLSKSTQTGKEAVVKNTQQNEFLSERFNLLRLIKASATEPSEVSQFAEISEDFRNQYAQFGVYGVSIEVLFQSILFIVAVFVIFASISVFPIQLAMLLLFLFVLVRITTPLRDLNARRHELTREIPSFGNIDSVLKEVGSHHKVKDGSLVFQGLLKEIQLSHVHFSYDGKTPVAQRYQYPDPQKLHGGHCRGLRRGKIHHRGSRHPAHRSRRR